MSLRLFSPDLSLGRLPEGVQFLDAATLKIAAQGGFHPGEAVEEAVVGSRQPLLGIEAALTRHVHQDEQQIAQFLLGMAFVAAGHRLLEFVQLLMDLLPDAGHVIPLEAGFGCFF